MHMQEPSCNNPCSRSDEDSRKQAAKSFKDKKAGGDLHLNLRINGRRRYRRRNKAIRNKIPGRIDISQRPAVVDLKTRYGDWEADLIEGARSTGYILSLYERKCHFGILVKIQSKNKSPISFLF